MPLYDRGGKKLHGHVAPHWEFLRILGNNTAGSCAQGGNAGYDGQVRGLFVFNNGGKRLDMIAWNHRSKTWEHNPAIIARYQSGDLDGEEISRAKAEEIASGFEAEVPSEKDFMKIPDLHEQKLRSRQK